jgi:hypothetical protein
MSNPKVPARAPSKDSLSVELGGWFKANATGKGVFVIGAVLVAIGLLGLAEVWVSTPGAALNAQTCGPAAAEDQVTHQPLMALGRDCHRRLAVAR